MNQLVRVLSWAAFMLGACHPSGPRALATDASVLSSEATTGPAVAPAQSHGWPVLEGLRPHCHGSAASFDGTVILWEVFVSERPPAEIAARYRERLTGVESEQTGQETLWRAPDAQNPERVLSVGPPGQADPSCPPWPPGIRTAVNASETPRRP